MNIPGSIVNLVYRILEEALQKRVEQYSTMVESDVDQELKRNLDHEIRGLIGFTTSLSQRIDDEYKPKKEEQTTKNPFTWAHEDPRRW